MKVLVDLNIVLDVALVRQPWFTDAQHICDASARGQIQAYLAATTFPRAHDVFGGGISWHGRLAHVRGTPRAFLPTNEPRAEIGFADARGMTCLPTKNDSRISIDLV